MATGEVADLATRLQQEGFKADNKLQSRLDQEAGEREQVSEPSEAQRARGAQPEVTRAGTGRRANGPYEVLGAFRKGDVTVVVEQNTQLGVTLPAVAIIEGPNGYRVAANPDDTELVAELVATAAGEGASQ